MSLDPRTWDRDDTYVAVVVLSVILMTSYGTAGLIDLYTQVFSAVGLISAPLSATSGLIIESADYVEFDSNHPDWEGGRIRLIATVGLGAEQGVFRASEIEGQIDGKASKSVTFSADSVEQKCNYKMAQKPNSPVYDYTIEKIDCSSFFGCSVNDLNTRCNQKGIVVRNFVNNIRGNGWGESWCIYKEGIGDLAYITKEAPSVSIGVSLDNGENKEPATIGNYGNQEADLGIAKVQLIGLTSLGNTCPEPSTSSAFKANTGRYVVIDKSLESRYVSESQSLERELRNYPADALSGLVGTGLTVPFLNGKVNSIDSTMTQALASKPIQHGGQLSKVSGEKAIIDLSNAPVTYGRIVVTADAEWFGIYKPIADLKITQPKNIQQTENQNAVFQVQVYNPSEVIGFGTLKTTCNGRQEFTQPITIGVGQSLSYAVEVSGTTGTKECNFCIQDNGGDECKTASVQFTAFRECFDGDTKCEGKQPVQCINKKWSNVGTKCGETQECGSTPTGIGCVELEGLSCNEVCLKADYNGGTCEKLQDNLVDLPFIDGKKNLGYAVGDCGKYTPPESCICKQSASTAMPLFLATIVFMVFFALAKTQMYPNDTMRSVLFALVPTIIVLLLPRVGIDAMGTENEIKSAISGLLPTPYQPPTLHVVIIMAVVGALAGLAAGIANIVVGDEPIMIIGGGIVGALIGYAVKNVLTLLQAPLAMGVGILSMKTVDDILKKKFKLAPQAHKMAVILITLGITILAYMAFWYAIILLAIGLAIKALVFKITGIKEVITK